MKTYSEIAVKPTDESVVVPVDDNLYMTHKATGGLHKLNKTSGEWETTTTIEAPANDDQFRYSYDNGVWSRLDTLSGLIHNLTSSSWIVPSVSADGDGTLKSFDPLAASPTKSGTVKSYTLNTGSPNAIAALANGNLAVFGITGLCTILTPDGRGDYAAQPELTVVSGMSVLYEAYHIADNKVLVLGLTSGTPKVAVLDLTSGVGATVASVDVDPGATVWTGWIKGTRLTDDIWVIYSHDASNYTISLVIDVSTGTPVPASGGVVHYSTLSIPVANTEDDAINIVGLSPTKAILVVCENSFSPKCWLATFNTTTGSVTCTSSSSPSGVPTQAGAARGVKVDEDRALFVVRNATNSAGYAFLVENTGSTAKTGGSVQITGASSYSSLFPPNAENIAIVARATTIGKVQIPESGVALAAWSAKSSDITIGAAPQATVLANGQLVSPDGSAIITLLP